MAAEVRVEGVTQRFGAVAALTGIDLRIGAGEFVTLFGPSGCGKTTLLRIIAGLQRPTDGSVMVDGRPPEHARAAKTIGFVPQSPGLLPWRTVKANAQLLLDVNRRQPVSAAHDPISLLDEVGLGSFLDAYPHELSGGMQQRVALVRAFALGAGLLVMDEPFAALDEMTREDMRHLLVRLCERTGATVVFVTHSVAEAAFLSDRVVVMTARPGRVHSIEAVGLPRPRVVALETDPQLFAVETRLRAALHAGSNR